MIVTNRHQIWVEMPVIQPLTEEQAVFWRGAATVFSSLLWAGIIFIFVRAIVLNIQDHRRRKAG